MPFPFGKSHKSPADIVKNLKDNMTVLEKHDISDKKAEKVVYFSHISLLLFNLWDTSDISEVVRSLKYIVALHVIVCTYMCVSSGHRGGFKEPSSHEGDPVWD